ncbi:MAG: lipid A biosynthesis lauroyl acyltransferase [Variibacter sp.]|nr:lipid A biosynthesis lauroyl acyltransferase [Variibacter sp.]
MVGARARRAPGIAGLAKSAVNATAGTASVLLLKLLRRSDPERMARFAGWALGRLGRLRKEHGIARANLAAAFPEKSAAQIEDILRRSWENLARVASEYPHLDRIMAHDPAHPERNRVSYSPGTIERFNTLRDDGRPALLFAAHLGNWELPAVAAASYGLDTTILYRPPTIGDVADAINRIRAVTMGRLVASAPDAAIRLMGALERGSHVAMLVDQHSSRGVDVVFFGRRCKANPMIARLARHLACPIHGARAIRQPDNRFVIELTPEVPAARGPDGAIDVAATMQAVTTVIEGWVREHPEQWLWQHRRWRE